jgi:hypothetical protein
LADQVGGSPWVAEKCEDRRDRDNDEYDDPDPYLSRFRFDLADFGLFQ